MNAGLDALAHSVRDQPVGQELIDSMKQHGAWQSAATLTREASMFVYAKPPAFLTDPFFTRSVSPAVIATLSDPDYQKKIAADPDFPKYAGFLEMAQKNLKRLADAGIPYGMGTDTGPPGRFPGFFEHWEMELMVDAGVDPIPGDQGSDEEWGRIPAGQGSGHFGGWEVGRHDCAGRRSARQHPQLAIALRGCISPAIKCRPDFSWLALILSVFP